MITLKPSKSKCKRDRKKRKKALAAAQEINATLPLDENNAEETKSAAGLKALVAVHHRRSEILERVKSFPGLQNASEAKVQKFQESKKLTPKQDILTTAQVTPEILELIAGQTKGAKQPLLLKVLAGAGLATTCHANAKAVVNVLGDEWEVVIGWSIIANAIGCAGEVHAVAHHKPTGTFVDTTPDFNDETKKWFMPLPDYNYYNEIFGVEKYQYITLLLRHNVPGYDLTVFTDHPSIADFNARFDDLVSQHGGKHGKMPAFFF